MPTATMTLLTVAALLAGCAQQAGRHGAPAILHIGSTGTDIAAGTQRAGAPMSGSRPPFPGWGGYVLAGTLPHGPTHAPVWRWTGGATTPAARGDVVRLAGALGLEGTPQRHAYGWELRSQTGDLRVRDGGGHDWSYVRADLEACPPFGVDVDGPANASFGCASAAPAGTVEPMESTSPRPQPRRSSAAGQPPGPDAASTLADAHALLAALGSGTEQVDVGIGESTLVFSPTLGSLPTIGIETQVDVDRLGIRSAQGRFDTAKAADDYPLRSARAAFADLGNGPRPMIAQYCGPMSTPTAGPASASPASASPASAPPASAAPVPAGTAPPYPCPSPAPTRVTGAVLGLQAMWDGSSNGANILVPSWFFSVEGSNVPMPVVAVDPAFVGAPTASVGRAPAQPAPAQRTPTEPTPTQPTPTGSSS